MRIGLIRHFQVKKAYPRKQFVSMDEVMQWFREYEEAEIEEGTTDLGGIEWHCCFSSDSKRALHTAKLIFAGPIATSKQLREIPIPMMSGKMKLPFMCWATLMRLSQWTNRGSRMELKRAREAVSRFLDEVMRSAHENVLIVSHAALMVEIRRELVRRGFRSPVFTYAKNGQLYVFDQRD